MKYFEPVKNFLQRGYILHSDDGTLRIHKKGTLSDKEMSLNPWDFNWILRRKINRYMEKNDDIENMLFYIGVKNHDKIKGKIGRKISKKSEWDRMRDMCDDGFGFV